MRIEGNRMDRAFYFGLTDQSIAGKQLPFETCERILTSPEIELLPLLDAAYQVRQKFWGKEVQIHIINNAQNGHCSEDCGYCAQAKTSRAGIEEYSLKPDEEILAEARQAYASGAFRYCMVFAGRGPSPRRIEKLCDLVRKIKAEHPQGEICISAGLLNSDGAAQLKAAGLDQLNHNLNTSREKYPQICTTHTYDDRLATLHNGRAAGIHLCSGMIVGMGELNQDIIEVAQTLRTLGVESIPVNFLIPIEGNQMTEAKDLTPEYCLRVLCLFRFLNPQSEIRIAAGREVHLRSLEVMSLYPANSLFLQGYLNTSGSSNVATLQMIQDAGFTIRSRENLDDLIRKSRSFWQVRDEYASAALKSLKQLRPALPLTKVRGKY